MTRETAAVYGTAKGSRVTTRQSMSLNAITQMPSVQHEVTITNSLGLHARPAMQFVDLACTFSSRICVQKLAGEAYEVDGKSVMQMITLEAYTGTRLNIRAEGDDAAAAVQQLVDLVANKFGEE